KETGMTEVYWKVITAVCLGAMLFVIFSISTGRSFLSRLLPAGSVVQTASATILRLDRESQLITASTYVQAVIRQKDIQPYGTAEVVRIVPARIHYGMNLNEIDRNKMEYDAQSGT